MPITKLQRTDVIVIFFINTELKTEGTALQNCRYKALVSEWLLPTNNWHLKPVKMLQVGLKFYFWLILRKLHPDIYYYKIISVPVLSNIEYQKSWYWIKKLKRGHHTADKILTSLQKTFFYNGKNGSVEPQLFEEIFFSSKIKLEIFRKTKCCKIKNVCICDDCTAKEKKCISSDMSSFILSLL